MLAFALYSDRDIEARCFVWAASAVFAACCVFIFAPWEWDNMKLMLWSWLVIAPYLWKKMLAPLKLPARAAVCVVLFFSGGVSLIGGLDTRHGYAIAQRSELAAWQHAIASIPPDVRFASVSDYNHPLILLGRKVACGYEGHLWSHGLDYHKKLELLDKSLNGEVELAFERTIAGRRMARAAPKGFASRKTARRSAGGECLWRALRFAASS